MSLMISVGHYLSLQARLLRNDFGVDNIRRAKSLVDQMLLVNDVEVEGREKPKDIDGNFCFTCKYENYPATSDQCFNCAYQRWEPKDTDKKDEVVITKPRKKINCRNCVYGKGGGLAEICSTCDLSFSNWEAECKTK